MVDLLVKDAAQRHAKDPMLWKPDDNARKNVLASIKSTLETENPPFRQQWFVAESKGDAVGLTHIILLPVPPIYAGEFGAPGLLMEDCFVSRGAPKGTYNSLLKAAEADLVQAGAKILVASSARSGDWQAVYAA